MSYGITFKSAAASYNDSTPGVTFVTLINIPGNTSGSRSFPQLAGFTLSWTRFTVSASAFGLANISVSYTLGYPVLSWSPGSTPNVYATINLLVYAR